jgi:hypothetical protein
VRVAPKSFNFWMAFPSAYVAAADWE